MTYQEIATATASHQLPIAATNEHGENVTIEHRHFENKRCFKLTTAQHNGWCRIDCIYDDGLLETTYRR